MPVSASTSSTLSAGTLPRAFQFMTTLGFLIPSAAEALEGPPRCSIAASTGGMFVLIPAMYHAT